jgi:hypothetical protein
VFVDVLEAVVEIHLERDVESYLFESLSIILMVVTFADVIIKIFNKPFQLFIFIIIELVLIIKVE